MDAILGSSFPFELDSEGSLQCVVEVLRDPDVADEALARRDGIGSAVVGGGAAMGVGNRRGSMGEGAAIAQNKPAIDVDTFLIDEDDSDAADSEPPTPKLELELE
jgi:hypothetical protein